MEQLLFYNGTIITMEGEGNIVESVLVEKGMVKAIGQFNIIKKQASQPVMIDLKGGTLLPAFVDCHSHITQMAQVLQFIPLSGATSFEEIKNRLKEKKVENENQWIVGFGYDQNILKEEKHPDKFVLDEVSKTNPVLIMHASGHMGCVNSNVLEREGMDRNTKDPVGGKIGRIEGTTEPSGYLEENAFIEVAKHMEIPQNNLVNLFQKAQEIYLQNGITTVQDGFTRKEEMEQLSKLNSDENLIVDVVTFLDLKEHRWLKDDYPKMWKKYDKNLKIGGYKIFLDGSPQGRTAWVSEPYRKIKEGDVEERGYPIYSDEQVENFVKEAKEDQAQLLIHCNGDCAIEQGINAHKIPSNTRNVLIHSQLMRKNLLPRVKEKQLIPSYFVAHTFYWGDAHRKNLGETRAKNISPVKSTINMDIVYTFHQDSPVIAPNMIETLWCATNRITRDGIVLGENEKISLYDALKAITINGAYQYFEEDTKGSIRVGKRADLVRLDQDILTIPVENLRDVKVVQTYKDGKLVYDKKK